MFVQLLKDFLGHAPGKRIDVSEEHGKVLIERGIAEAVADDPLGPLVARTMDQVAGKLSEGVTAALAQFAQTQEQSRRLARPAIFGDGKDGDPKRCFGDWLLHVARNDERYLEKTYATYRTKAAMAEGSGTTGGYLVPPEFYQGIMQVVAEQTFFRKRAFVQPMASASLMFPYLDITTAPKPKNETPAMVTPVPCRT